MTQRTKQPDLPAEIQSADLGPDRFLKRATPDQIQRHIVVGRDRGERGQQAKVIFDRHETRHADETERPASEIMVG